MSGVLAQYAEHFKRGLRVRIGVPLSGGGTFREWGVVESLQSDLLEVELSRESLPVLASLEVADTVDLEFFEGAQSVRCRGMVAAFDPPRPLVLRLLDQVAPYEPREFFRQDVYLPLDYRLPPTQHLQEAKERWRQARWALEFAAQEAEPGESAAVNTLREEIQARLEKRKSAPPVAANISGGGLRLNLSERLRTGTLVELSIYLPHPQRVLEIVGEVVQLSESGDRGYCSTALRYRFIDEADRDRLIGYISAQQLSRLADHAPRDVDIPAGGSRFTVHPLRLALGLLLLAALVGYEARSIVASRQRGEKHEIERVFEQGVSDFLRQRR
jgi:hypothetical protein